MPAVATINERLFDAWVRRMHDLVRIENGIAARIRRTLNPAIRGVISDLRRANVRPSEWDRAAVAGLIYRRIIAAARNAYEQAADDLLRLAPRWFEIQARTVFAKLGPRRIRRLARRLSRPRLRERDEPVGFAIRLQLDPLDIIRDFFVMTGQTDMPGFLDDVLSDFSRRYDGFADRLSRRIVNAVDLSIEERRELLDALNDLQLALDQAVMDFERTSGDAVQQLAFDSEELLLDYVGTEIDRVMYVAILDMRTCLRCQSYSGTIWRVDDESRPTIPIHPACRCGYAPLINGDDAPERPDYADWFRRQHWTRQRRVLGPSRYRLYRQGVPIDRFVNNRNRILRIEELPEPGKIPASWRRSRRRGRSDG